MVFTSLHKSLAREPGDLEFGMIEDAISQKVTERADLDWKQCLPMDGKKPEWKQEFAKDVAAMANSGGGTIVFGIEEDRATSAANAVAGTGDISDANLRTLHSVAFNNIHPPVLGLRFTPLSSTDGSKHVLVLEIPDSPDTPHLIYNKDYFGAPIRNGTGTAWMTERLLHNAYKLRFGVAAARSRGLNDLLEVAMPSKNLYPTLWIGAVAQPSIPRDSSLRRVTREEARSVLLGARKLRFAFAKRIGHTPLERIKGENPRMGLRRWIDGYPSLGQKLEQTMIAKIAKTEIHDDGAVTLTAAMGGFAAQMENQPNHVHVEQVEAFVVDFVALVGSTARVLAMPGGYDTLLTMRWSGGGPMYIRMPDPNLGHLLDRVYSTGINEFVPVSTVISAQAPDSMLLTAVQELALDVTNQGGAQKLYSIKDSLDA